MKTGYVARMIDELEFEEDYRNEFLQKLSMIDNAVKIIQHKKTLEYQKKQAAEARRKAGVRGKR